MIGCPIHRELYPDATLMSDDAGQFQVLGFTNGLCWIHAVRHIDELVSETASQRRSQERVLTKTWKYYRRLKAYRESATQQTKTRLCRDFDANFGSKAGWPRTPVQYRSKRKQRRELRQFH